MKRVFLVIVASAVIAGGSAYLLSTPNRPALGEVAVAAPTPTLRPSAVPEEVELRTNHDAREVFRRAFWREPGENDRILHAERREWVSEKDGVRRWQWFIEVQPGPELATWLQERNPFGLQPVALDRRPDLGSACPAWFPQATDLGHGEVRQSTDGGMTLITRDGVVYATDAGHGFAVAVHPAVPSSPRAALAPAREYQPLRTRPPETSGN